MTTGGSSRFLHHHWAKYGMTMATNKNISTEKKARGQISFKNTKSEVGEQVLLQDCTAKACVKGVFFLQTPVSLSNKFIGIFRAPPVSGPLVISLNMII